VSELTGGTILAAALIDLMITAIYKLDKMEGAVFYMNRIAHAILHKQVRKDVINGGGLTFMNFEGEQVMSFNGLPIRIADSLLTTEARVV
jgi:hypothetical protein